MNEIVSFGLVENDFIPTRAHKQPRLFARVRNDVRMAVLGEVTGDRGIAMVAFKDDVSFPARLGRGDSGCRQKRGSESDAEGLGMTEKATGVFHDRKENRWEPFRQDRKV